jgi:hypothetical protein
MNKQSEYTFWDEMWNVPSRPEQEEKEENEDEK